jgi:hypothetical protein
MGLLPTLDQQSLQLFRLGVHLTLQVEDVPEDRMGRRWLFKLAK